MSSLAYTSTSDNSPDDQPPHTNRGVGDSHNQSDDLNSFGFNCEPYSENQSGDVKFSLDWWRVTIWCSRSVIAPVLERLGLDVGLKVAPSAGMGFKRREDGLHGFQLYSQPVGDFDGDTYVSLNFPSKCLQNIGHENLERFVDWLCERGQDIGLRWDTTRLDLAFDTQGFKVADVVAAYHDQSLSSVARRAYEIKDCDGSGGHTFYLGSRESEAMVRVYNKLDGHSFGDESFTRVELELKGKRAAMAFLQVMAAPLQDRRLMAGGLLMGFMTIAADWWTQFTEGVSRSWMILRRSVPTIEAVKKWLHKQVSPSLATYIQAVSAGGQKDRIEAAISDLLAEGKKRIKKHQWTMIDNYSADAVPQFAVFEL